MTIETPTIKDLAGLVIESEAMFNEMGFDEHGNAWEYDSVVEWWTAVLTTKHHDLVVAKEGPRIVGVSVVCYPDKFFWHKSKTQAIELVHHAAPDLPAFKRCKIMILMLEAIEEKIAAIGPLFFKISYSPKPEFAAWGQYLMKRGYLDSSHVLVRKVG